MNLRIYAKVKVAHVVLSILDLHIVLKNYGTEEDSKLFFY